MPCDIICLQHVFRLSDNLGCGVNLKNERSVACTSCRLEERRSNNSKSGRWRQVNRHRSHHQQYTTQATSTRAVSSGPGGNRRNFWEKFPKHEVRMEMDANTKLAGHSDGAREACAVPNSDDFLSPYVFKYDRKRRGKA